MAIEVNQLSCAQCGAPKQLHRDGIVVKSPGQPDVALAFDHIFEEPPEIAVGENQLIEGDARGQ